MKRRDHETWCRMRAKNQRKERIKKAIGTQSVSAPNSSQRQIDESLNEIAFILHFVQINLYITKEQIT